MSFKINDYNAFLSSLVEREKESSINPPSPFGESQIQNEKFPIDFDFYIQSKDKQNEPSTLAANGTPNINPQTMSNSTANSNNNSLSISVSPTSNYEMKESGNNEMIDNLIKQDQMYTAASKTSYSEYGNEYGTKFPNARNDIFIKQESSDEDILSPDLELPDAFYNNFNNINNTLSGERVQRVKTNDTGSSPGESISEATSTTPSRNSAPLRERKHVAVKMESSAYGKDRSVASQSAAKKQLIEDQRNQMLEDLNDSRSFRPRMRSSHNVIEQRYRNKINDKFTALQNSVPTLRIVAKRKQKHEDVLDDDIIDPDHYELSSSDNDDLEGLEPARKLNKGIILSKSIEYIKFLELKNNRMRQQREELLEKAKLLGIQVDESQL